MERLRRGSWQRRTLFAFLALCVLWIVGVAVWLVVALVTPPPPEPWEDEERVAGLHHDQLPDDVGRFYVPESARTEKDGTVVLRYKLSGGIDSNVSDFRRTYGITAQRKQTRPNEVTFTDHAGDRRRTFTVVYGSATTAPDLSEKDEAAARITVRAAKD